MGSEAIKRIAACRDSIELRVLIRPEEAKHPLLRKIQKQGLANIIWGDLTDLASIERGVKNADTVLHVGGLVSPVADYLPQSVVEAVNVRGAANIITAIKKVADPERTRLIYIGTVAQTGSRNAPIHWGRTGDPLKISAYDYYAITKTRAEALVAESGLRYWVSLRQSGMAHLKLWKTFDPIMFHNPINGVFEWSTANDSGRLMAALCKNAVPDSLWRGFYNIGGGESSRVVNHEFMTPTMAAVGVKDYREILKPHWFATQNFHGQWYADSDLLESLVPFRQQSITDYFKELPRSVPWYVKTAGRLVPGAISKRIEKMSRAPHGSLFWFENNDEEKIRYYFKSRQAWEAIPRDWDSYIYTRPSKEPTLLDHGYDESKSRESWTVGDMRQAAQFRGGRCQSHELNSPYHPLEWQCAAGHSFNMSANLVLKGGHWCPACTMNTGDYDKQARHNAFFAQVWLEESNNT
ncbi:NAD-dependent epimerase/dehydratase family protein [bacterium AH-315-K03]|nr:NAD-dependent epimerase/dehydratase family protein [bacterium AH-315-K03]